MNKKAKIILLAIFGAIILICAGLLIKNFFGYQSGDTAYEDAVNAATAEKTESEQTCETDDVLPEKNIELWVPIDIESDAHMEKLASVNIVSLQEKNKDVVGWIQIPGTKIDYPMVQGEDNTYYLEHVWDGKENFVGSIFIECQNSSDFTDWNTIIYGHNMANGSMFGSLKKYKDPEYFQKHPYIYIVIEGGVLRYEIFSAYTAEVDSQTFGLSYHQMETREKFIDMAIQNSNIDTGIIPAPTDQIITLSTCSGDSYATRQVIHARLPMIKIEQ